MNIPFVGDVSTGVLLATLIVLVFFYMWVVNPRILNNKNKKKVSIVLLVILTGLYLTNSLVMFQGESYSVEEGGTFMLYPESYTSSIFSDYDDLISLEIFWVESSKYPELFKHLLIASEGTSFASACDNQGIFTKYICITSKVASYTTLKANSLKSQRLYSSPMTLQELSNKAGQDNSPPWDLMSPGTKDIYLFEYARLGKGCVGSSPGLNCDLITTLGVSSKVTITPGTPTDEMVYECGNVNFISYGPCPSGETCVEQRNGETRCVGDEPPPPPIVTGCGDGSCDSGETCDTCPQDCGVCSPETSCPNGVCANPESCSTCPQDCGACDEDLMYYCYTYDVGTATAGSTCTLSTTRPDGSLCYLSFSACQEALSRHNQDSAYCGDALCNNGETQATCPGDCGSPSPTTCTSLGGVAYNPDNWHCEKKLEWTGVSPDGDDLSCCATTPVKPEGINFDLIIVILVVFFILLIIVAFISHKKNPQYPRNMDQYFGPRGGFPRR